MSLPHSRRAVLVERLDGPEALTLATLAAPTPTDGVGIRVHHAGVAFPDLLMSRGAYQRKPELPFSPGVEVAGTVLWAPPGSPFTPGQRVAAFLRVGGWTDVVEAREEFVFPLPDALSLRSAAGMPMNYLTAHLALALRGGLRPGETLLVHGAAGGLGTALVQVGKALGARVVAVASTPQKREVATACGADVVLATDGWAKALLEACPEGVDVVADTVGGPVVIDSLRALRKEGRLVVLGFASGTIADVATNRLLLRNVDVRGVAWGSYIEDAPELPARQWADVMQWHSDGFVSPVDGRSFRLEEASQALAELDLRSATGKITLALNPSTESEDN